MRNRQLKRFFVLRVSALSLLALGVSVASCGASAVPESAERSGSLGLALEIAPGITLGLIDYSIVGPDDFAKSGTIDVTNSTRISAVIGGIPAGAGYTITLFGDSEPNGACTGSASFQVEAQETASVQVGLRCKQPPTTGSVAVNGAVSSCPQISNLSITPSETIVGAAVTLTSLATDPDASSTLGYSWHATSGSLENAGSASTRFTCTAPGVVSVTLDVTDGSCSDSATAQLTCSPAELCGNGQLDAGEQCDDGNQKSGDGCSASCVPDDDLRTPGDDRAGYFKCNTGAPLAQQVTCGPGQGCCGKQHCASSCLGIDNQFCDGPEDCTNGGHCVEGTHTTACDNSYAVGVYCHHDADCIDTDPYVSSSGCGANGLCHYP